MKRIKTGLTGFILGDWLGMPYRGKGKGTFKPMWTKSYLRGDKCSGNTSMLLCALDSRCNLELYQQNLRDWYFNRKYTGENIEFDIDQVTQKAIMKNFRGVSSDSNSGNRSLMGCCVLAFSPLSKEEIFPFIKITHNIVVIALSILGFLLSLFVACWNMKIKDRHYSRLSRDVVWRLTGKIFVMEALL